MKISQRNLGAIFSWANSRARTGNPPPHPKAPLCLTTDVLQDGLRGMLGWWHEIRGALPSKLPHLEEEESGRGPHLRCGAASRRWRKQAGAKTASQGHMLLYIPIRITLLWNVRKCVVSASASPRPHGPTQSTWSPLPHPGLAPTGILTKKGRASKSCLEFSPHPFSPSWGFILHPRIRHTDCGPQVPSVAVPPPKTWLLFQGQHTSPEGLSQGQPSPFKLLPPVLLLLKDVSANQTEPESLHAWLYHFPSSSLVSRAVPASPRVLTADG